MADNVVESQLANILREIIKGFSYGLEGVYEPTASYPL